MYQDRIVVDPEILAGKPTIRGTRIPVELVLKRLAENSDVEVLFNAYPRLTIEDVRACLSYVQENHSIRRDDWDSSLRSE
jgi:uncharacterized protein (DUF433 family)